MPDLPYILIASNSMDSAKQLIENICHKKLGKCEHAKNGLSFYTWNIDNKYYEADLNVMPICEAGSLPTEVGQSVEAFLLHSDWDVEKFDIEYERWRSIVENSLPEIKMIIYDHEPTSNTQKELNSRLAQEWCLKHEFELVDLHEDGNDYSDNAFDLKEAQGFDRIVEALHSHTWPNLKRKSNGVNSSEHKESVEETAAFSTLFAQFQSMKDSVQSMPLNQRRECAEQVVKAFWQAIGGDESEIDDIIED